MTVKYTTQQIFWKPDSEDKPSLTYFEEFKKSFIDGDIKVNFLNYDNVEIVGMTDNITYVWINLNGKDYYYYTNSITKVLNKGFTYNLFLDTFTSFTLPFLEQLKENNVTVYSLRSHYHTNNYLKYSDELLNNIPKIYNNQGYKISDKFKFLPNPTALGYEAVVYIDYNSTDNYMWGISYNGCNLKMNTQPDAYANGTLYYVFSKDVYGENSYLFIPVLYHCDYQGDWTQNIQILQSQDGGLNWKSYTPTSSYKYFFNSDYNIEEYKNKNINTFLGIYILPNFLSILNYNRWGVIQEDIQINDTRWIFGFAMSNNQISLATLPILELPQVSELLYNNKQIGDKYLFNYMNYKYYNNDLNINLISDNNEVNLYGYLIFGGSGLLYSKKPLINLNNSIYQYPYQTNSLADSYLSYVQTSWNQVNTSYSIAKQNTVWDSIRNVFSGGMKLATSVATGNVAGAVSAVSGTAFSLAGTQLNLSQKRRMIQAQYKDARNCYGNKLNFSTAEDCSYKNYLYIENNEDMRIYEFVTYSELSESTIIKLNNTLYLYGWFEPQYININTIINYNFNNFRYILLDEEHTDKLINAYSTCFIKYRESILNDLTSGIRLWNQTPNYGQEIQ